jgi:hypothetical protein
MRRFVVKVLLHAVSLVALATGVARADVLLDQTSLIGLPSVAAPSAYSFTASTAQALTLTLTDLQTPAAFSSLQVAVTLGDTLVGSATIDSATHKATLTIPAAAGDYTLHVIGTPDSAQGFGSFGACVAPAASPTSCIAAYSYSDVILTPATPSSTPSSALDTNFTATVAGTYTVTITDDAFPTALQSVSGGIFDGATPVAINIPAGSTQVTLAAGTTYNLIVAALANASVTAGLYSIQIVGPAGAVVFDRTLPVGTLQAPTIVDNPTAQSLSLSLADLAYPAALSSVGVAVTEGSSSLAQLTAAGTVASFPAPAGSVEIWHYAVAGAQPGVYSLSLSSSTASLYSTTQVVSTGTAGTAQSFAFVVTLPSAGTYNLVAADFQFPKALQSLTATVAQNGVALQQTSDGNFTGAQGLAIVVVNTTAPQAGNGIFSVSVQTTGASPQILLDQTQAVGGAFTSQTINLGNSGNYSVTLTDLGFPATFENLAVVVSQGSKVLGKIYGGGTFNFSGTPGQFVLTFVATPAAPADYGLYTIYIASSVPTVTFSASTTSLTAGQPVQLTWSTENATACTASGGTGWSGGEPISGSSAIVVDASETLTLTCSGPGGSAAQSINVSATAAPAKSGGGGNVDWALLAMLGALIVLSAYRRSRQRPNTQVFCPSRLTLAAILLSPDEGPLDDRQNPSPRMPRQNAAPDGVVRNSHEHHESEHGEIDEQ